MQMPDVCKGMYHEIRSFTLHALNLNIWVIPIGFIAEQSQLQRTKMYILGMVPTRPSLLESSHACHLHYDLIFQGDLPAPFRACSCRATISETTQSHPHYLPEACYLLFTYMIFGKQFVYAFQGTKDYNYQEASNSSHDLDMQIQSFKPSFRIEPL